jgi:two-component system nitrogen regulation response regulator GlnG/two-component system response regulator AtoC
MPAYDDLLETVEATMLETLLKRFDGKPTRLAAAMKMNRATLRRKLREE